ncbi:MAG: TRAP transporter substrate-binding protein [Candidatus Asgardarchaeum sp.]
MIFTERKKAVQASLIIFVCLLLVVSISFSAQAEEETIVLKFSHDAPIVGQTHRMAVYFADLVAMRTNNKVKIEIFPNNQLGGASEQIEACKMGLIEIVSNINPGNIARFVPEFSVLSPLYLFKDMNAVNRFTEGPIAEELNEKLVEQGLRTLCYFFLGTRQLTCNKPVYKPEDLKGVKIRSIPTPTAISNIKALGATPTPVDFAELYGALQNKIVEGQETPLTENVMMKFYQVQKYLILTGHQNMINMTVINEKKWNTLPSEVQKILIKSARDAAHYHDGLVKAETKYELEFLKEHLTVIGPEQGLDIQAFRERAFKMQSKDFEKKWGDLYKRIYEAYSK